MSESCLVIRCDFEIPKIIHFVSAVVTFKSHTKEASSVQKSCNVCGDTNCSRDKVVHKQKPWVGLLIPIEIDEALEKVCSHHFAIIHFLCTCNNRSNNMI